MGLAPTSSGPIVSIDMTPMRETILRFEQALLEFAPERLEHARPPATQADIEAIERRIAPLKLPESAIELARWHDGGYSLSRTRHQWFSLRESVDARDQIRSNTAEVRARHPSDESDFFMDIPDQWLPLVHTGITLLCETSTARRVDSPVWSYSSAEPHEAVARFSSVERMIHVETERVLAGVDRAAEPPLVFERRHDPDFGRHANYTA